MNPASAILKPEWHDCPAFGAAWEATRRLVCDPRAIEAEVSAGLSFAKALGELRVVKADGDQLKDVLRAVDGQYVFAEADGTLKIPFASMLLDLGAGRSSFVAEQRDESIEITPIPDAGQGSQMGFSYVVTALPLGKLAMTVQVWTRSAQAVHRAQKEAVNRVGQLAMHQLRAFCYLLRAANVNLAEPELPRGARRTVARRNQRVPLVIQLRRSGIRSVARGGSVTYSHAHDRAGNFAHHFEQTRDGKPNSWFERWERDAPDRAIEINGQRCYRIWRPPTVVGIGDGPYVPKVRDARALEAVNA